MGSNIKFKPDIGRELCINQKEPFAKVSEYRLMDQASPGV